MLNEMLEKEKMRARNVREAFQVNGVESIVHVGIMSHIIIIMDFCY